MLLQHDRTARDGSVEVSKGSVYERVLIELHVRNSTGAWTSTCDGGCTVQPTSASTFRVDLNVERFSLVLVNEIADDALTQGANTLSDAVVEIAVRPSAVEAPNGQRWLLIAAFTAGGVSVMLIPRKVPEIVMNTAEDE